MSLPETKSESRTLDEKLAAWGNAEMGTGRYVCQLTSPNGKKLVGILQSYSDEYSLEIIIGFPVDGISNDPVTNNLIDKNSKELSPLTIEGLKGFGIRLHQTFGSKGEKSAKWAYSSHDENLLVKPENRKWVGKLVATLEMQTDSSEPKGNHEVAHVCSEALIETIPEGWKIAPLEANQFKASQVA